MINNNPNKISAYPPSALAAYEQVINHSPHAVIISDENDHILFANHQARRWFGMDKLSESTTTMTGILGKTFSRWLDAKSNLHSNPSPTFQGKVNKIEIEVVHSKLAVPEHNFVVSFIRDISGMVRLEAEFLREKSTRELILDSIPALVFVKDTENRIISMNKAYRQITGLQQKDIEGRNVIDIMEDRQLAVEYWKDDLEVIETGLPKRNIIEPMITDQKKWFITDKIPYRNNAGEIVGIIGFSIDITERKNAEDALMRSEKKFRLLYDTSPDGIVISYLSGQFISANKAFQTLLGYENDAIENLSFRNITPDAYEDVEKQFVHAALSTNTTSATYEKEYLSKNGLPIPVSVSCWIIYDELSNPIQMGANVKDLTFQKKAEQLERSLLQKEKEQLQKDLNTKTQELNAKITQLIEKNELVNSVVNQLEKLKDTNPADIPHEIGSLIRDLKNNTNEDFWSQFETTFGQVNQSFYDNIFKAFPNLTNNERKISAFLKMNLSTKEIANITHQSIRSIEMARSRLRTKLKISRSENLSKFLNQF